MRQFDVYLNSSAASSDYAPYLVVLQSHHLEVLDSVVVAPLINDARRPLSALDVSVAIEGQNLVIATAELASVPSSLLKKRVGSLGSVEDDIRRGLERLFSGF